MFDQSDPASICSLNANCTDLQIGFIVIIVLQFFGGGLGIIAHASFSAHAKCYQLAVWYVCVCVFGVFIQSNPEWEFLQSKKKVCS